jgi:shikimate kinase
MTPQQLHSRLSGSSHIRPLIKNMNDNQLLAFIQEKLESRENCYKRAEIIIDSMNLDLNSLLELIKIRNDK